jgi:hypothetical protein
VRASAICWKKVEMIYARGRFDQVTLKGEHATPVSASGYASLTAICMVQDGAQVRGLQRLSQVVF